MILNVVGLDCVLVGVVLGVIAVVIVTAIIIVVAVSPATLMTPLSR